MGRPTDLAAVAGLSFVAMFAAVAALATATLGYVLHSTPWYGVTGVLLAVSGLCAFRLWQAGRR